jgi:membrane associated rhomboid family serine protease
MDPADEFRYVVEDRFTLFAVPAVMSAVVQLATHPTSVAALAVQTGHTTATFKKFLQAINTTIFAPTAGGSSDFPTQKFPTVLEWKPIFTHQFIHYDLGHYVSNFITLGSAVLKMTFPSFANKRGWRRGGFLTLLMAGGSISGALAMDYNFSRNSASSSSSSSSKSQQSPPQQKLTAEAINNDPIGFVTNWFSSISNSVSNATASAASSTKSLFSFERPIMMMGMSNAIFAVTGYDLVFSQFRPAAVANAVLIIGSAVYSEYQRRVDLNNTDSSPDFIGNFFEPNTMIAHAGHLGGFFFGMVFGYACRAIEKRRRQQQQGRVLGRM